VGDGAAWPNNGRFANVAALLSDCATRRHAAERATANEFPVVLSCCWLVCRLLCARYSSSSLCDCQRGARFASYLVSSRRHEEQRSGHRLVGIPQSAAAPKFDWNRTEHCGQSRVHLVQSHVKFARFICSYFIIVHNSANKRSTSNFKTHGGEATKIEESAEQTFTQTSRNQTSLRSSRCFESTVHSPASRRAFAATKYA
jgi:hypothetical protein